MEYGVTLSGGVRHDASGNRFTVGANTQSGFIVELYTTRSGQGGHNDSGGFIGLRKDFGSSPTSGNRGKAPQGSSFSTLPYNVRSFVAERPGFVPYAVRAIVDHTATPKLLVQIDTKKLPSEMNLDRVSGDLTTLLPEAPGNIESAINTSKIGVDGKSENVSTAFSVSGNNVIFRPRALLLSQLASGMNTLVVTTSNNFRITIVVEKGSIIVRDAKWEKLKDDSPDNVTCDPSKITIHPTSVDTPDEACILEDRDNPSGFNSDKKYIVKNLQGVVVKQSELMPSTAYILFVTYKTSVWDKTKNTLTVVQRGEKKLMEFKTKNALVNPAPTSAKFTPTSTLKQGSLIPGAIGNLSCENLDENGKPEICTYEVEGTNTDFTLSGASVILRDTQLAAGEHPLKIKVMDSAKNSKIVTIMISIGLPENTAPDSVTFSQAGTLKAGSIKAGDVVGFLSCKDFAPTGTQDSCIYSGKNENFEVLPTGAVKFLKDLPAGEYSLDVTAKDGGNLSKTASIKIVISSADNTAPSKVTFAQAGVLNEGSLTAGNIVGFLSCVDTDPVGTPNACIYSGGDEKFQVLPTGAVKILKTDLIAGDYVFTVSAKDAQGLARSELVKFTVSERLNSGPNTFPAITPISFVAGSTGSVVLPATTHPKGFSLTYGIAEALPVGFSFDATTRTLSWKPGAQPGVLSLTLRAIDTENKSITTLIPVTVSAAQDVPTVENVPTVSAITHNSANISYNISDPDGLTNPTCEVQSTTGTIIGSPMIPVNGVCEFGGLPASTQLFAVTKGFAVKVLPDGSKQIIAVEKRTPFTTAEAPDTVKPVITLAGTPVMNVAFGSTYTDPGATCTDNKDVTCTVVTTGTVNTSVPGAYTITYTATDKAGNVGTTTRTVNVAEAPLAQTTSNNLGNTTLGTPLTRTLEFNTNITSVSVSGLPAGVTAMTTYSGKNVFLSLSINPLTFVFSSATQNISLTLTVNNTTAFSQMASVNDVALIPGGAFATLPSIINRSDFAGYSPIVPIDAGGVTDPLGRTIVYSATGLPVGLSIDPTTGRISGTYDSNAGGDPNTGEALTDDFSVRVFARVGIQSIATPVFTIKIADNG